MSDQPFELGDALLRLALDLPAELTASRELLQQVSDALRRNSRTRGGVQVSSDDVGAALIAVQAALADLGGALNDITVAVVAAVIALEQRLQEPPEIGD